MEALQLGAAVLPLAAYLVLLGILNSGRRPVLMTGSWDSAALAFGLSGMLFGLLARFVPFDRYPAYVWAPAAAFVVSGTVTLILLQRRRLIIYNLKASRFAELLPRLIEDVDSKATLVGSHLVLPSLGLELQVDRFSALRNISIVEVGGQTDGDGWKTLTDHLARRLGEVESAPGNLGQVLVAMGCLLLVALPAWLVLQDPHGVTQALLRILQLNLQ